MFFYNYYMKRQNLLPIWQEISETMASNDRQLIGEVYAKYSDKLAEMKEWAWGDNNSTLDRYHQKQMYQDIKQMLKRMKRVMRPKQTM